MPGKVVESPLLEIWRKHLAMVSVKLSLVGQTISRGRFQSQPFCASVIPLWMPMFMALMDVITLRRQNSVH